MAWRNADHAGHDFHDRFPRRFYRPGASRAAVTLYYFRHQGQAHVPAAATGFLGVLIMVTVGGKLYDRFEAFSGDSTTERSAYGSYQDRMFLMWRALDAMENYPVFGIGVQNFPTYSLNLARRAHDLPAGRRRRRHSRAHYLSDVFPASVSEPEESCARGQISIPTSSLFVGALTSSLVGFVVGALFAPETYQYFPYFAVAFTQRCCRRSKNKIAIKEPVRSAPPPKKPRHFLEAYADHGRTDAVAPVR